MDRIFVRKIYPEILSLWINYHGTSICAPAFANIYPAIGQSSRSNPKMAIMPSTYFRLSLTGLTSVSVTSVCENHATLYKHGDTLNLSKKFIITKNEFFAVRPRSRFNLEEEFVFSEVMLLLEILKLLLCNLRLSQSIVKMCHIFDNHDQLVSQYYHSR